jgi:hypothetical protein
MYQGGTLFMSDPFENLKEFKDKIDKFNIDAHKISDIKKDFEKFKKMQEDFKHIQEMFSKLDKI